MKNFLRTIILLMLVTCNIAYAEPKIQDNQIKTSGIVVQANVPEKFDKKVYINFLLEDGTNANYTLTSDNKYKENGEIEVGKAKLNFVKIVNNEDNQYQYSCEDSIDIKEGEKNSFNVKITSTKEDVKESSDSNSKKSNSNIKIKDKANDTNDIVKDKEEKEDKDKNTNSDFSVEKLVKDNAVTIVVFVAIIITYFVLKKKDGEW